MKIVSAVTQLNFLKFNAFLTLYLLKPDEYAPATDEF